MGADFFPGGLNASKNVTPFKMALGEGILSPQSHSLWYKVRKILCGRMCLLTSTSIAVWKNIKIFP